MENKKYHNVNSRDYADLFIIDSLRQLRKGRAAYVFKDYQEMILCEQLDKEGIPYIIRIIEGTKAIIPKKKKNITNRR